MLNSCAVALILMVDVSASVTPASYQLQQQGIADAFRAPEIQQTIESKPGGIAVSIVEWGAYTKTVVKWRVLKTKEDANNMADASLDTTRSKFNMPTTAVGDSIHTTVDLFDSVPCDPERKVIDVSGDGRDNQSTRNTKVVTLAAYAKGITINGLPIEDNDEEVVDFYKNNVATPDGFIVKASSFADFARAIRKKISLEIM